nr:immunoglobulin heavy chain junction region [Macaca mulatta]MOV50401.1 immunoglobulin heavy chain junction region [Macaca mulatta]MOV50741.1 immunoglobulin heavy chain junction region [Macaca mulatta]MOV52411.1 immunoglobulin heavy chain junction region [Macaca mulatta]
CARKQVNFDYW